MKHFPVFPLMLFLIAISMVSQGQTVTITTDKDDYYPGEWVIITGSGWDNDANVQLSLTHLDPLPDPLHTHESWLVQPNAEGYIYYEWFVDTMELYTYFQLDALGMTTGLSATTNFTDALTKDIYPLAFTSFTGGSSYCQGKIAKDLVADWNTASCGNGGANHSISLTIQWYENSSNSTSGGTLVKTKSTNTSTITSSYTPPTTTLGTLYYYVVVSWKEGQNCATAGSMISGIQRVTVNSIPATPTITASGPTTFCPGGSVTLTSSSGTSYLWSNGATTQSINVTSAGNYTVQVTNADGCQSVPSAATSVTVNAIPGTPTVSASGSTTFCTGGSVTLTSGLGSSYLWSTGETTQSINVSTSGNYTVRVTNASGCQSNPSAVTTVTVNPIPAMPSITVHSGTTTFCEGGAVLLSSSSSSGNQWHRNGLPISGAVNSTYSATGSGSYTVVVTANGCPSPASEAISVTVNSRPTGSLSGTQTICTENSATLSIAVTGTGPWTGTLTGGISFSGSSSPITVNVSPTANTTYALVSLEDANCSAIAGDLSGTAEVTVRPVATASISITGNSILCSGSTTTLKITGPVNGTVVYTINGGSAITGSMKNGGNLNLTTANLTANTTYHLVSVAYGDAPNCSNSVNESVTITVNQPPVITTQPENQTLTYGSSTSFTVASTGIPTPTYQWQVNTGTGYTDIAGATSATLAVENPTVTMNGTKYRVMVNNSCATITSQEVGLTVNARPVTITADAKSKTYGDADPALTYQITSGTLVAPDVVTGSLTRDAGESVGTYAITQGTVALNNNYALSYISDHLTVIKRPITITADAKAKTYGDADPALTAQASNTVSGDVPTGSLSRAEGKDAGSYAISQSTYTYGSNYDETFEGAYLVIGQRPITITADAQSKTYGDQDPELTAQATNTVNGDQPSGTLLRVTGENVGSYAISQSTYTYGSNYSEKFVEANLVIGQRPITITADPQSKTYGDDDPELTAQATNTVNDDQPSGSLLRVAGENVGSYAISQSTYTYGSNYDETFVEANLVIGQRPITITADAKTKTYGDQDPELTAQAINTVNDDQPSGTLLRVTGENVGSYAISKNSYTYGSNYAETFVEANLVIGQLPVTVTAVSNSKYFGQKDPALTFVSIPAVGTRLANGEAISFDGSLKRIGGECVSEYDIEIGSLGNANFKIDYKISKFSIKGVSIDASQSSIPIPLSNPVNTILKATVLNSSTGELIDGIEVLFEVVDCNGILKTPATVNALTGIESNKGEANFSVCTTAWPIGLYKIIARVVCDCAEPVTSIAYMTIYDPNGSFITGGGWIKSPAGALTIREGSHLLEGKANFGFNAKYTKGKTTIANVEGNTEFQFQTGNFNFKSNMLSAGTLVISGAKATFRGEGTVNGTGNYGFMVSAVDGQISGGGGVDLFRIKIWDKSNGNKVVYDNNIGKDENILPSTELGGGSIVIHEIKTKSAEITTEASVATFEPTLKVYPNPFTERLNIEFSNATDTKGKLEIYSITGARLQTLYEGPVTGGQLYNFEYLPRLVSSQVVFYHLTLDGKTQVGKILFNERR